MGVEANSEEAVRFFRLAAAKGNSLAQYSLAICLKNGTGVRKDFNEARYLHRLSKIQIKFEDA